MLEAFYFILCIFVVFATWKTIVFFLQEFQNTKRSLELCFLQIGNTKKDSDSDEKKETARDFKEMVAIMEQLLSSLKSTYSNRVSKLILGQDLLSLEYISHDSEIKFYIVCPRNYKKLIEKQIHSFYPDAIIEETKEINIFEGKNIIENTYVNIKKTFKYPIKTYQKLESDPINNITNALSKLESETSAALQIIINPISDDWQKETTKFSSKLMGGKKKGFSLNPWHFFVFMFEAFTSSNDDKNPLKGDNDKETSALTQEKAKIVDEKGAKTGYEVVIRIVVTSNNLENAKSDLDNIVACFAQFSYPEFNRFKRTLRHWEMLLVKSFILRSFRKPFWLPKMILNTEEIASIFHFPHSKYNKAPDIKWQNFKVVKAPTNIPKEGTKLGTNVYRGVKKDLFIKNEDRFRHFYIIGQTGTGKSTVMLTMAKQDLKNGNGIAVIDPHGDLIKDLLPHIPRERADDVVIFDPSDLQRPVGLNMLEAHTKEEKENVTQEALNIMIKLFGNEIFGPRLQDYFRNGALTLMDWPDGGSIIDIVKLFTDDVFQQTRRSNLKNAIVRDWWENTYSNQADREKKEIIPFMAAKFGQFTTNENIRNIIGQLKSSFDIYDIMQSGKIFMANLSKGLIGDLNSELLGLILVSKIQMASMQRAKVEKDERTDFFMYIDEFQNYVTPSIATILSEARKYRLGMILAHQYIKQLEKSDALTKSSINLKDAIFGNVGTIMSYKIGPEDAEFMAKYYQPTFSDSDLINMDKFRAVMKLAIDNQPSTPFSIIPDNPYLDPGDKNLAKAFVELSRLKYGREKEFVGREIEYRIGTFAKIKKPGEDDEKDKKKDSLNEDFTGG